MKNITRHCQYFFNGKITIPVALMIGLCGDVFSQNNQPEKNLEQQLAAVNQDSARSRIYREAASEFLYGGEIDQGDSCADLAILYAEKSGSQPHLAHAHRVKGAALDYSGRYNDAVDEYNIGIGLIDTVKYPSEHGSLLIGIANAYFFKGSYNEALDYYFLSMYARRRAQDSTGMAGSMMGIANVYAEMDQDVNAVKFYKEALGIYERHGNKKMISWLLNNLGSTYVETGEPDSALPYFERSIQLKEEEGDMYGLSTSYINLGEIYLLKEDSRAALYYFRKAYEIRKKMDDSHDLATTYLAIGKAYAKMRAYDSALVWIDSANALATRAGMKDIWSRALYQKADVMYQSGNGKEAYEYLMESIRIKDSLISEESRQQINELIERYDTENKEQRIALQNSEIASAKTFRNFLYAIIALAVLLGLVVLGGFIRKQKTNKLLAAKNALIEQQSKIVEEKNKDIIDSITYAKRIQTALLPSESKFSRLLEDGFVFYQPRDIVSGDFYMTEEWGTDTIVAAVDCTGHGVPGAFMSFMAYDLFQEAVMEHGITAPEAILSRMRAGVTRMLVQGTESKIHVYDGMDAAICTISGDKKRITYAGAYRPLWLFRDGNFIEYKETKCSVSPSEHDQIPFTSHEIETRDGDMFYAFSDGYADQFGGPNGKKFKVARLKELLARINSLPTAEQLAEISKAHHEWKGNFEQVDDILVMGFRIKH